MASFNNSGTYIAPSGKTVKVTLTYEFVENDDTTDEESRSIYTPQINQERS